MLLNDDDCFMCISYSEGFWSITEEHRGDEEYAGIDQGIRRRRNNEGNVKRNDES